MAEMNLQRPAQVPSPYRLEITVRGVVQGVGFRPFVYQTARNFALAGWVRNEADAVCIEVQGDRSMVERFVDVLRTAAPPQARIDSLETSELPFEAGLAPGSFRIDASEGTASPRPTIPADLAVCNDCLAEIRDPSQRRYRYPFTNCTNCGPRWSIIESLPYDRPNTSMASFAMCDDCRAEYENPGDRRFHAQPIACPKCGPKLQLLDPSGHELATGESALVEAVRAILDGRIMALKGLGGFQLLADAANAEAVAQLRRRKHRPDRPFALMIATLDAVRRYCLVSDAEARALASHESPIVLLHKRDDAECACENKIVECVAPGNPYLGVMLPYTPLHHLLMDAIGRPIVCTSGNLSEEPMAITTEDALVRLGPIADLLLSHDRPIVRPVDDSIVRAVGDDIEVLRRARGFAPLPIKIAGKGDSPIFVKTKMGTVPKNTPTVLALGGHLKNTVALLLGKTVQTNNPDVILSAHIGDLESVASVEVFRRAADDLVRFYRAKPEAVACDLHPDYASTQYARQLAERWNAPLLQFQHHHAHVAACMAEHGLSGPVLGFAWDGTGYGPDGTVWGGEVLLCEGAEYRRAAHLKTFPLPGGEIAMREPRRSALGALFETLGHDAAQHAGAWFKPAEIETLITMLQRGFQTPRTSSMGRLFDAVAAFCGLPPVISFEGQAAMALEYAARIDETDAYPMTIDNTTSPIVIDWSPLIRSVMTDRAAGAPVGRISAKFHNALADMAVSVAKTIAGQSSSEPLPIVLSGGCFQNALLARLMRDRLSSAGFRVYNPKKTPPGDGGVSLGQVFLTMLTLRGSKDVSRHSR